jgi:hypothetical protein
VIEWEIMGEKTLTPAFLIVDVGSPFPPDLLECIPFTALVDAPRDDPSDGLAHGFGRFLRSFLEIETSRIDVIIP